jgi:hypothetical protein
VSILITCAAHCNLCDLINFAIFFKIGISGYSFVFILHVPPLSGKVLCLTTSTNYTSNNLPRYYKKSQAANAVLGSWWWALCRPKHVEIHINME